MNSNKHKRHPVQRLVSSDEWVAVGINLCYCWAPMKGRQPYNLLLFVLSKCLCQHKDGLSDKIFFKHDITRRPSQRQEKSWNRNRKGRQLDVQGWWDALLSLVVPAVSPRSFSSTVSIVLQKSHIVEIPERIAFAYHHTSSWRFCKPTMLKVTLLDYYNWDIREKIIKLVIILLPFDYTVHVAEISVQLYSDHGKVSRSSSLSHTVATFVLDCQPLPER